MAASCHQMTKQVNQLNDKQIVETSSNPFIILTKTSTTCVCDIMHKPSTQLLNGTLPTRPSQHNAWAQFGMKKTKSPIKINAKMAERGSKSLTFKMMSKKFQPSILDSLKTVQRQSMVFQVSSG